MMILPLSSRKLKVNLPNLPNMFIRIIAATVSWFCFQIWFCHVLLKWYCNSLLLLSRLTRETKKKLQKPSLWIWNWISHRDCRKVSWQWLVTRVAWATELLNSGKQFRVLNERTMENWIRLHVLSCCLLHYMVPDKSWNLMMTHWKVKILTTVNSVSPKDL